MPEPTTENGWKRVSFGDVVRQIRDRIDPREAGIQRYVAGDHMDTDDLRIRRWGTVGDGYLGPAFHMRFKPGHVLYGSRRTYLRKIALADFEGVTANTTFVIESKDSSVLLPELLPFVMQTPSFHEHSVRQSKGSVNPYVNFSDLRDYQFAIPPLHVQRRIASVLNASVDHIERIRTLEDATSILLTSLVESVAVTAISTGSLSTLDDLVEPDRPITYGILKPGTGFPGGVPVIKVKDYPDDRIVENGLLLTDPEIDKEYRRSRLRKGDLLISIRGTIGRLAFVPSGLSGANITQDTARLSLRSDNNPTFIRAMLGSEHVQRQIVELTTGLAVKGINIGELRGVRVPIVEKDLQEEVCRDLSVIHEAVESCRRRLKEARSTHGLLLLVAMSPRS